MNILSIGGFSGYGDSNTCLLRHKCLQQFGNVDKVDTTSKPINFFYRVCNKLFQFGLPIKLPDICRVNSQIVEYISDKKKYDVIWIDKGILIDSKTFESIRKYQVNAKIVGYSPDWMAARHNQSQQFIESLPYYDCFVTTKSYSVEALRKMGAKDVLFIDNAFQSDFHYPRVLTTEERKRYESEISFIGSWEKERSDSIEFLGAHDIRVNIWGSGPWEDICKKYPSLSYKGGDLKDDSYCKALSGSKISLCFLRKLNLDLQTTRSLEIPACGSLMLAERTKEHQSLFEEGKEADYFSSDVELLNKCLLYLNDEELRKKVAKNGYEKCVETPYSYEGRIKTIMSYIGLI